MGAVTSKLIAVIIGGAETVGEELKQTAEILTQAGMHRTTTYFGINDAIPLFGCLDVAVTLHPEKLPQWIAARREAWPDAPPVPTVAHREAEGVDMVQPVEYGSSGLFATCAALRMGARAVVLCGVGMTVAGGHFQRHAAWTDCPPFLRAWEARRGELARYVRSWGGWTRDTFGVPSSGFLADAAWRPAVSLATMTRRAWVRSITPHPGG